MAQRTAVQRRSGGPPTGSRPNVALPNRYKEQPQRTGWYALAAFFALVALGLGGFLLFDTLTGDDDPSDRTLQNYIGQPLADVVADLDQLDIAWSPVERPNDRYDPGIVHETDPVAGTVISANGSVTLYYNPDTARVPPVAGLTVGEARTALTAAGFVNVSVGESVQSDSVSSGLVVRSEPGQGTELELEATITLILSAGDGSGVPDASEPEPTADGSLEVPYVIEMSEAEARSRLADFEVQVTYADVPIGSRWDGNVMDQNPIRGASARPGDTVTLTVGEAPEPPPPTNPPQTNPPQTNPPPPQTNPPQTNPPQTNPPTTTVPATTTTVPAGPTTTAAD